MMTNIDFSRATTAAARAVTALGEARETGWRRMVEMIEAATETRCAAVPLAERLIWSAKEEAARALVEGRADAAASALIEAEAQVTGEAPDVLAARILCKAGSHRMLMAQMSGLRRKAAADIAGAESPAEVERILTDLRAALVQKSDDAATTAPAGAEGIEPDGEAML
ncbi:MAG: hypothetical protein MUF74_06350 [Cypionkella sp.]|jgi:hypothetical protein|nr:hypothetical protein [Cypionkella sp.]